MKNEEELINRLSALLRGSKSFDIGKVTAVSGLTCTVLPINGDVEITGVRLSFNNDADSLFVPAVNSLVVIGKYKINKMQKEYFIVQCTKVESIKLHGEGFGGLVMAEILTDRLNKLETRFNDFKTKFNSHTHLLTLSSGTGTAAITANPIVLSNLTETEQSDLENSKVKHG